MVQIRKVIQVLDISLFTRVKERQLSLRGVLPSGVSVFNRKIEGQTFSM